MKKFIKKEKLQDKNQLSKDKVKEAMDKAKDRLREKIEKGRIYVKNNPEKSKIALAGLGAFVIAIFAFIFGRKTKNDKDKK